MNGKIENLKNSVASQSLAKQKELNETNSTKLLKIAFVLGAVTDFLAIFPMLFPPLAKIMWGFKSFGGDYFFAMGCGAAFMTAWTLLLIWAYKKPLERKAVALLTVVVILGFVATELYCVASGVISPVKMIVSWSMQTVLCALLILGYLGAKN